MKPIDLKDCSCTHDCLHCGDVKQDSSGKYEGVCENINSPRFKCHAGESDRCDHMEVYNYIGTGPGEIRPRVNFIFLVVLALLGFAALAFIAWHRNGFFFMF